jgi:hypothetical protein
VRAESLAVTITTTALQITHNSRFDRGWFEVEAMQPALQQFGCISVTADRNPQFCDGGTEIPRYTLHFAPVETIEFDKSRAALAPILPRIG